MDRLQNLNTQIQEKIDQVPKKRDPNQNDLEYFQSFLKPDQIETRQEKLKKYNIDTQNIFQGHSELLIWPKSTEEVSKIMKYCHEQGLKVVLQSGHSSLVGGGTPVLHEIILNFEKMNKIVKFDEKTAVITCEPGCILGKVQKYLEKYEAELPFDIMSRERCMIGGNVATHAGGIHFLKHGPMRAYVLGLEVVLANGEILNMESEVRKDNTLQDLKQLFIGSEGTLGIVTRSQIQTVKTDKNKQVLLAKLVNYQKVLDMLDIAKDILGPNMSAFEYFDFDCYQTTHGLLGKMIKFPFDIHETSQRNMFYALIEVSSKQDVQPLLQEFLQKLEQKNIMAEHVISKNQTEFRNLWMIRKMVANAFMGRGIMLAFDLSLNITEFDNFANAVRKQCGRLVGGFGHMGDGNIHLAILCHDQDDLKIVNKLLDPFIYEYISNINGSISAEHGIGRQKQNKMKYAKTQLEYEYIKKLKLVFDPRNTLNSYAFEQQFQNGREMIHTLNCW